MCGIAGYIQPDSSGRASLRAALSALRHRGPDDHATTFFRCGDREVGLGSTRLAIVDLSPAGHMPMATADGACSIVFNGEIYDAAAHRGELVSRGVRFRSRTDTEVLLYGLALDGPAFLDRVDGMYALAFWDSREPAGLLLARDRFGEKPLFIARQAGSILFASELPAILRLLGNRPEVDSAALRHVLEWGYPPAGQAVFQGIRKLRPGAWEWFGDRRGAGELAPLESRDSIDSARTVPAAAALVREALDASVRDRLVADVPVGVFLSGGIDSAGVAALAARHLPGGQKLNTYTVGYPGSNVSELEPARQFSAWLGTEHHEFVLGDDSLAALPWVAAALGEPVADPAALPTYFLSAFSRRSSTVLLTGEGADEIFFGYPRYLWHDAANGGDHGSLTSRVLSLAAGRLLSRVRGAPSGMADRDRHWKGLPWSLDDLLLPGFGGAAGEAPASGGAAAARWSRADDLARWLHESVLVRVDRMTMGASIESRAPFLAREVARLGLHLPDAVLRRFPFGKVALRAALKPYFPRFKHWGLKRPFAVPLVDWLTGPLRGLFDDLFFGERLLRRGWFRRDGLRALGHAVLAGDRNAARMAWTVVTLELWSRAHLDGETPAAPDPERLGVPQTCGGRGRKQLVLAMDFPPDVGGIQLYNKQIWGCGGLGDIAVVAGRAPGEEAFDRTFPARVFRLRHRLGKAGRLGYLARVFGHLPAHLGRDAVIHVAHVALAPAVFPYSAVLRNPVVVWTYALELTNPRLAVPIRWLLARADRVVVISEYTRRLALECGAHSDRIVKISPAGDDLLALYPSPDAARFRSRHGIAADEFLLLSVGRLSPHNRYKGFDRAIEAACILRDRGRRFRWVAIGGGPDQPLYRARVQAMGLERHMSFVGSVDDRTLADAYAACDLFSLLSREEVTPRGILAEGYGIVYAQAGSFGKPVIGLRRGGVPDAVLDRETGILIDEDSAGTVAAQVEALMDNPAERERLGRNGLHHSLGEGSWSAARRKVREMLDGL